MKRLITRFLFLSAVITAVSCSKDSITPDDLFNESAKAVKTEISRQLPLLLRMFTEIPNLKANHGL